MTKLAKLAHLQKTVPGKSDSWYRKVLGLNSKTYRMYAAKVKAVLSGNHAVCAKTPSISSDSMVCFGEVGSIY